MLKLVVCLDKDSKSKTKKHCFRLFEEGPWKVTMGLLGWGMLIWPEIYCPQLAFLYWPYCVEDHVLWRVEKASHEQGASETMFVMLVAFNWNNWWAIHANDAYDDGFADLLTYIIIAVHVLVTVFFWSFNHHTDITILSEVQIRYYFDIVDVPYFLCNICYNKQMQSSVGHGTQWFSMITEQILT